jgi:hypothetical protein
MGLIMGSQNIMGSDYGSNISVYFSNPILEVIIACVYFLSFRLFLQF